jgi:hypothetical protein
VARFSKQLPGLLVPRETEAVPLCSAYIFKKSSSGFRFLLQLVVCCGIYIDEKTWPRFLVVYTMLRKCISRFTVDCKMI